MKLAEFEKMWNDLAKTEEGAVKMYCIAAIEHIEGNADAEKMAAITLPKNYLNKRGLLGNTEKYRFEHMKEDGGNAPKSYLGGTPDNNYAYSYDNEIVSLPQSKKEEKKSKILIQSGGKDNPTANELKKNKHGYWKLFNVSSVATGVKRIEDDDF